MTRRWTRQPIAAGVATFLAGGAIALSVGWLQAHRNGIAAVQRFDTQAQRVTDDIASRLRIYEYGLRGARGAVLAAGVDHIDRQTFGVYSASRDLKTEFPGARGVGIIKRVPAREEASFVAVMRQTGSPAFAVRALAPNDGDRFIIQYVEPEVSNAEAIGLDIGSEESRRSAAMAAIRTGAATITKPLTIAQASAAHGRSFLLLLPIFRPGALTDTPGARDRAATGWSFAPLVIDDVLRNVSLGAEGLALTLRDVGAATRQPFFVSDGSVAPAARGLARRITIPVFGRAWEAELRATPAFWNGLDQFDPRVAVVIGLAIALLIGALVTLYARMVDREWEVRQLSETMTAMELGEAKRAERLARELSADLEAQVLERTALLDAARRDLQAILDASPLMIGYWDKHLTNRMANRAYASWFGLTSESIRGRSYRELLGQEHHDVNRPFADAALRGEPQFLLRSSARPDGTGVLHSQSQYVPDVVDGKVRGFHVIVNDISELTESRLKLAAVVRENEALLRTLRQHAIVCVADADGRIIDVNDSLCRISGYAREEMLGRRLRDVIAAAVTPDRIEDVTLAISGMEPWRGEVSATARDGTLYWLDTVTSPFFDENGKVEKLVSISTDITSAKRLEQQLRFSQALLDRAGEVAGIGGWELDLRTGALTWSAQTYRIREVGPEFVPTVENGLAFYAPETRALMEAAMNATIASGESWDLEVPLITATGRSIWVRTVGTADFDGGKAIRLVGAIQDISARKEAEAALEHERHLFTSLLDTVPDSIYFKDTHSRFLRINRALANHLGLDDPADAIGKSDDDFFAPEHARKAAELERQIMETGTPIHDQEEHAVWLDRPTTWSVSTRMPLHDHTGRVMGTFGIGRDVTSRKRMELQLQRSNDRMELAAEAGHLGIWEYEVGTDTLTWDDRMFEIYGTATGRGPVPYAVWADRLHPEDRSRAEAEVAAAVSGGAPFDTEFRIVRPNGDVRYIKAAALVARSDEGIAVHLTGVNVDVTEQKRADLELMETSSLLRTVLASASEVSVIATDANSVITVFNSGAERMLGYRSEEVVGLVTPAVLHDADEMRARSVELTRRLERPVEGTAVFTDPAVLSTAREWSYLHKNGRRITVSLVVTAMHDDQGRILGHLGIAHDVTRQKDAELSLRKAVHTERRANQAKSQFLANMSHEIRTPLNAVIGLSYLLGRTTLDPKQATMLGKISIASKSLLGVINDILDLSKIEAGELIIERVAFDARTLLRDVSEVMSVNAEAKGIDYSITVDADVPETLEGDPTRLGQILTNLVSNAVKFTEVGGVHLTVRPMPGGSDTTSLRFAVQDSGIGISADAQARLFAPFAQADASTTRRFGGTGLGLSIVKRLANLMGGDVGLTSVPGAGSEFWVVLPLGQATTSTSSKRDATPPVRDDEGLQGLRILVVDDSDVNREVAQRILELEGASVTLANDGQQAIDRLRATPRAFDVVLMDVQMPVVDGNEAARTIRNDLGLVELPIIALTAGAMQSERALSTVAGMNAFVTKPFEPRVLLRTIREHIDGIRSRVVEVPAPPHTGSTPHGRTGMADIKDIPGIDYGSLGKTLRGDKALFDSLLSRMLAEYATFEVPTEPLADEALRAFGMRMHKLKGTSGTLGVMEIYRMAGEAEQSCMAGDGVHARVLAETIVQALVALRTAVSAAAVSAGAGVSDVAPVAQSGAGAQRRDVALEVRALVLQLRERDLDALEQFREIADELRVRMGNESFERVSQHVDTLEFDAAAMELALLPD
ncbi:MAG: PAS domain-containing protein [bacterium]